MPILRAVFKGTTVARLYVLQFLYRAIFYGDSSKIHSEFIAACSHGMTMRQNRTNNENIGASLAVTLVNIRPESYVFSLLVIGHGSCKKPTKAVAFLC
jgi:hypothetical protein